VQEWPNKYRGRIICHPAIENDSSAILSTRTIRTIWIVDAHGYGKHFVVRADEKLTAFLQLEAAIHEFAVSLVV
jgi:hypothetical protein